MNQRVRTILNAAAIVLMAGAGPLVLLAIYFVPRLLGMEQPQ